MNLSPEAKLTKNENQISFSVLGKRTAAQTTPHEIEHVVPEQNEQSGSVGERKVDLNHTIGSSLLKRVPT